MDYYEQFLNEYHSQYPDNPGEEEYVLWLESELKNRDDKLKKINTLLEAWNNFDIDEFVLVKKIDKIINNKQMKIKSVPNEK